MGGWLWKLKVGRENERRDVVERILGWDVERCLRLPKTSIRYLA